MPVAPWWHTVLLVVVVLGFSVIQGLPQRLDRMNALPSRIPIYGQTLGFELVLFAYVWLAGILPRGVTIGEIIGGRWKKVGDFIIDIAFALLLTSVVYTMLIVYALLTHFSGAKAAAPLLPKSPSELAAFLILAVTAGFCEEFIFRGYLQRQMLALTGKNWASVGLQAVMFGAAHVYQGWRGVVVITVYGALFGLLAWWRRSLRPGMIQHAGQDALSGIVGYIALKRHLI